MPAVGATWRRRERASPGVPSAARERARFIALMLAPATVLLVGLTVIPFAVSLALSFTDYSLAAPGALRVTGLANYLALFASDEFQNAVRVTAEFTAAAVALELFLGVGMAALLHHESRAVPALRLIYLLPLAITPVAAVFTFRIMLNPGISVFNHLLRLVGLHPVDWLGTPGMAPASLVLIDAWQWTPFILLIAAGGLAAMDEEPQEAAAMDGAGPVRIFFHHTLPMLFPFLVVAVVFRTIDAFKTFDIVFVLTGGGPGIATRTLNLLAYKNGIEFLSMGYAAALAVVMLAFTIVASQAFLRRAGMFRPRAAL